MSKFEKINEEQIRQMEIHKWIQSERAGIDLSDTAIFEWVEKYAPAFRKFADSIPYDCISCGSCAGCTGMECVTPFKEERIQFWVKSQKPSP